MCGVKVRPRISLGLSARLVSPPTLPAGPLHREMAARKVTDLIVAATYELLPGFLICYAFLIAI